MRFKVIWNSTRKCSAATIAGITRMGRKRKSRSSKRSKTARCWRGVQPYRSIGSLYKNKEIAADCTLLMTGTTTEATEPITWTREPHGKRVFYTSLGHPQDFKEPSFFATSGQRTFLGR